MQLIPELVSFIHDSMQVGASPPRVGANGCKLSKNLCKWVQVNMERVQVVQVIDNLVQVF
jgi:hypothetical protein